MFAEPAHRCPDIVGDGLEARVGGGHDDVEPAHRPRLDEHHPSPTAPLHDVDPCATAGIDVDSVERLAGSEDEGGRLRRADDDPWSDVGEQVGGVKVGDGAVERLQREVAGRHDAGQSRHHRRKLMTSSGVGVAASPYWVSRRNRT